MARARSTSLDNLLGVYPSLATYTFWVHAHRVRDGRAASRHAPAHRPGELLLTRARLPVVRARADRRRVHRVRVRTRDRRDHDRDRHGASHVGARHHAVRLRARVLRRCTSRSPTTTSPSTSRSPCRFRCIEARLERSAQARAREERADRADQRELASCNRDSIRFPLSPTGARTARARARSRSSSSLKLRCPTALEHELRLRDADRDVHRPPASTAEREDGSKRSGRVGRCRRRRRAPAAGGTAVRRPDVRRSRVARRLDAADLAVDERRRRAHAAGRLPMPPSALARSSS